ncbi:MAG TPA: hypothetical protein PKN50_14235 [Spirochaetota bacterium]|nr:hypothetical protein [Spirochaetota bacterium]HPV40561.1 hypothetical protein [Spirochaetota bacterium]
MKKIFTTITLILLLGLASLSRVSTDYHIGSPAYALCTADSMKNDCCFKFFKVLESDASVNDSKTRDRMAMAEFRRCMRSDIGCSVEMTELKCKSVQQVRSFCR